MRNSLAPWIMASRPKTLPAGAGPVLLGLALAYAEGDLHFVHGALTLACALLLQISSNLINDYYDGVSGLDDHERLGPPRAVALGLLSAKQVKRGFQITLLLSFLLGVWLMVIGGWPIIVIGLSSLFFSWAYTGGPFPLSYLGLGEIFAFIFFGPVAVWGTWYLQALPHKTLFPFAVLVMGAGVGLISAALMGVNNLRDRLGDMAKGKKTLATFLGDQLMRKVILLFLLASQGLAFILFVRAHENAVILGLIPFFLFSKTWWQLLGTTRGKDLNNTLATVGKYLFLYSLTYSLLIIFFLRGWSSI